MSIYVGTQFVPTPGGAATLLAQEGRYQKLIEKAGGNVVAGFQVAVGEGTGTVGVLTSWPDLGAYQKAAEGFQSSPDWQTLINEVGSDVVAINTTVYSPTPNSPLQ